MNERDSGLSKYLKDIGQFPLLTRQQEMELAEKINEGDAEARADDQFQFAIGCYHSS